MIEILNANHGRPRGLYDIYIGRADIKRHLARSPLANDAHIGRDGTRAEVVEKYKIWLRKEYRDHNSKARLELERIAQLCRDGRQVRLVCWCKQPGREVACHGDVVRAALIGMLNLQPKHEHASCSEPGPDAGRTSDDAPEVKTVAIRKAVDPDEFGKVPMQDFMLQGVSEPRCYEERMQGRSRESEFGPGVRWD